MERNIISIATVVWLPAKHSLQTVKITQDILIVGANQDHFIPYQMIGEEINALVNVRSLTFRLFTDKEDAGNHCNCGNSRLVFDTFMDWIMQMKSDNR